MNITEKSTEINYLAAMAVFQQLFDEQKNELYSKVVDELV